MNRLEVQMPSTEYSQYTLGTADLVKLDSLTISIITWLIIIVQIMAYSNTDISEYAALLNAQSNRNKCLIF